MTVVVVIGVSGSGKSTIATALAQRLGWALCEGDDLHSPAAVEKMSVGVPLSDDDRWPWLQRVADWIDDRLRSGEPGVVACSALRRSYRDVLRRGEPGDVVFVYLDGSPQRIRERLTGRKDHFMPMSLLDDQFARLEPPGPDESAVDVGIDGTPDELVDEIRTRLDI